MIGDGDGSSDTTTSAEGDGGGDNAATERTFSEAEVQRLVKERLAQQAKSLGRKAASSEEIARERDELKQRLEALEEERMSEVERAKSRASKAEAAAAAEIATNKAAAEAATNELRRYRLHREIGDALATLNDRRGEKAILALTESLFEQSEDGSFISEDPATGKQLTVAERLTAWLQEPGNELYQRPAAGGSGVRGGAPTARRGESRDRLSPAALVARGSGNLLRVR